MLSSFMLQRILQIMLDILVGGLNQNKVCMKLKFDVMQALTHHFWRPATGRLRAWGGLWITMTVVHTFQPLKTNLWFLHLCVCHTCISLCSPQFEPMQIVCTASTLVALQSALKNDT